MNKRVLEVNHATMRFGGLVAVNDLSMHIDHQEIVALIGPNGAGKTTAFNMITGVYTPTSGTITLGSRSITGPYEDRVVLKQGSSVTNGPHQGAWVDTPNGEDWFLHFQSRGL